MGNATKCKVCIVVTIVHPPRSTPHVACTPLPSVTAAEVHCRGKDRREEEREEKRGCGAVMRDVDVSPSFYTLPGTPGHRYSPGKQPREHRRSTDMTYVVTAYL